MNQVATAIKSALKPIQAVYNKAFDANKYVAGVGLSILITTSLFFVMVILISLGDSGMKEDTSVKLADVVMPERQIENGSFADSSGPHFRLWSVRDEPSAPAPRYD